MTPLAPARNIRMRGCIAGAGGHYDEPELAELVVAIAGINAWNRIEAATRQITGEWVDRWISRAEPASRAA
jgi:hypothetical protein